MRGCALLSGRFQAPLPKGLLLGKGRDPPGWEKKRDKAEGRDGRRDGAHLESGHWTQTCRMGAHSPSGGAGEHFLLLIAGCVTLGKREPRGWGVLGFQFLF